MNPKKTSILFFSSSICTGRLMRLVLTNLYLGPCTFFIFNIL
jgi:hypothetical protein